MIKRSIKTMGSNGNIGTERMKGAIIILVSVITLPPGGVDANRALITSKYPYISSLVTTRRVGRNTF